MFDFVLTSNYDNYFANGEELISEGPFVFEKEDTKSFDETNLLHQI